ncbi:unnamed protein product [Trichobilharzia regenti]|nr:unnamed protein product [Trichobilharzia regenti]
MSNPKFSEHGGNRNLTKTLSVTNFSRNLVSSVKIIPLGWHIYGLIHKSDHKYEEAIKCYLQALRLDNDNLQVLRDLSVLLQGRLNLILTCQSEIPPFDYEHSELLLYQAMVMLEAGKEEAALEHLESSSNQIVDKISFRNFTETRYHFPLSTVPSIQAFLQRLDSYLKPYIRKGVPPLFIQLVGLLYDSEKLAMFESLLDKYRKNMHLTGSLDFEEECGFKDAPTTEIWLTYLLAQYYNFNRKYQEAIDLIDAQLLSTPTLVDFYVLKADVFHDAGDYITASRWMEEAQSLDTADRFINARCTKFMVEAHRLEDATNMASKFTRGNTSAKEYLSEMQCMWFLLDNAKALKEMGKLGEALKLCHEVNILDDQLDFHSYCLRKVTLRAYVETLRLEDRLRDHQSYFDTTQLAVEVSCGIFIATLKSVS